MFNNNQQNNEVNVSAENTTNDTSVCITDAHNILHISALSHTHSEHTLSVYNKDNSGDVVCDDTDDEQHTQNSRLSDTTQYPQSSLTDLDTQHEEFTLFTPIQQDELTIDDDHLHIHLPLEEQEEYAEDLQYSRLLLESNTQERQQTQKRKHAHEDTYDTQHKYAKTTELHNYAHNLSDSTDAQNNVTTTHDNTSAHIYAVSDISVPHMNIHANKPTYLPFNMFMHTKNTQNIPYTMTHETADTLDAVSTQPETSTTMTASCPYEYSTSANILDLQNSIIERNIHIMRTHLQSAYAPRTTQSVLCDKPQSVSVSSACTSQSIISTHSDTDTQAYSTLQNVSRVHTLTSSLPVSCSVSTPQITYTGQYRRHKRLDEESIYAIKMQTYANYICKSSLCHDALADEVSCDIDILSEKLKEPNAHYIDYMDSAINEFLKTYEANIYDETTYGKLRFAISDCRFASFKYAANMIGTKILPVMTRTRLNIRAIVHGRISESLYNMLGIDTLGFPHRGSDSANVQRKQLMKYQTDQIRLNRITTPVDERRIQEYIDNYAETVNEATKLEQCLCTLNVLNTYVQENGVEMLSYISEYSTLTGYMLCITLDNVLDILVRNSLLIPDDQFSRIICRVYAASNFFAQRVYALPEHDRAKHRDPSRLMSILNDYEYFGRFDADAYTTRIPRETVWRYRKRYIEAFIAHLQRMAQDKTELFIIYSQEIKLLEECIAALAHRERAKRDYMRILRTQVYMESYNEARSYAMTVCPYISVNLIDTCKLPRTTQVLYRNLLAYSAAEILQLLAYQRYKHTFELIMHKMAHVSMHMLYVVRGYIHHINRHHENIIEFSVETFISELTQNAVKASEHILIDMQQNCSVHLCDKYVAMDIGVMPVKNNLVYNASCDNCDASIDRIKHSEQSCLFQRLFSVIIGTLQLQNKQLTLNSASTFIRDACVRKDNLPQYLVYTLALQNECKELPAHITTFTDIVHAYSCAISEHKECV